MEASTVTVALCLMLLIIETKSSFLTVPIQAKVCSPFLKRNGARIISNYYMNPVSQDTESKDVDNLQDTPLSDIDARVLRSLLEDKNLDLNSEDNLRKILEKGSTPKQSPVKNVKESEFSSTFFQVSIYLVFYESHLCSEICRTTLRLCIIRPLPIHLFGRV